MTAPDSEEADIEASRAPLLDHLNELRDRIVRIFIAVALAFGVSLFFADEIYRILQEPYFQAWAVVYPDTPPQPFIITAALEQFLTQMRVALFSALALAFPYIAYEAYGFIAPGLYRKERMAVAPYLVAAPLLFAAGIALVHFLVMPRVQEFSLQMLKDSGGAIQANFRVADYLSLSMTLMTGFGLAFQLPLVLTLLARVGMVGAAQLRNFRKYAFVMMAIFAAIVTPPDPFSMMIMLVPLAGLYEISILLVAAIERARLKAEAETAQQAAE